MKTSHVSDRARNELTGRNRASWSKDPQAQLLRVELADGRFFLFPYGNLSVVKFDRHNADDLLNLRFASHEVQISGKHLRELGLAFQKLAVEWVKEMPARYATMANGDGVCIANIKVTEMQTAHSAS